MLHVLYRGQIGLDVVMSVSKQMGTWHTQNIWIYKIFTLIPPGSSGNYAGQGFRQVLLRVLCKLYMPCLSKTKNWSLLLISPLQWFWLMPFYFKCILYLTSRELRGIIKKNNFRIRDLKVIGPILHSRITPSSVLRDHHSWKCLGNHA